MLTLRLLADDLTGALDSAAQFTGRLGPIPVFLDLPVPLPTGHAAIDAGSRDMAQARAVLEMRRLAGFLEATCAFKKIDSLLRGNWASELAAVLETGRFRSAVLAPAFPEQGRITREGRQGVRAPDGAWRPLPIDIFAALRDVGLTGRSVPQVNADGPTAQGTVMIADAADGEDLTRIVRWGNTLPRPTLWIGSAGLARALAGTAPRQDRVVTKPILTLIGSAHPVMVEQVERARQRGIALCPVSDDVPRSAEGLAQASGSGRGCIATFPLPPDIAPDVAAERIVERIGKIVPFVPRFPTLMIAGGETLRAVCRASEAHWLVAESEFSPGVPRSRIVGGRWHGQAVISKSGAFGTPDFLATLI